jgi:hypothetical protein
VDSDLDSGIATLWCDVRGRCDHVRIRGEEPPVAERAGWVPEGVDVTVPNAARVYDCALGGYHNFAADREFLRRAEVAWPGLALTAHANRAYLARVVRYLLDAGVTQFLDIGSGIPTVGNVHEVAQAVAPGARVMYVDTDPVAVAHSQEMLAGNPDAGAIQADLRHPAEILDDPAVRGLLDFTRPIGLLLIAVLHFVADADDPAGTVTNLRRRLAPGSYVAISHGIGVPVEREPAQQRVQQLYGRTPTPFHLRTPAQIAGLLGGLDLVEPGLVPITDWRPDPDAAGTPPQPLLAAVGRQN